MITHATQMVFDIFWDIKKKILFFNRTESQFKPQMYHLIEKSAMNQGKEVEQNNSNCYLLL